MFIIKRIIKFASLVINIDKVDTVVSFAMKGISGFRDFSVHCFNFTDNETGLVFDYSSNNSIEQAKRFFPVNFFPDVMYWELQSETEPVYQWCGSMLMLANYYASFTKSKYGGFY